MTAPTQHWHARPIPPEAPKDEKGQVVRNDKGYYIEPPAKHNEASWFGRKMKALDESNRTNADIQRNMGYQVYQGDPGKPPEYMNQHEHSQSSDGCTIQ